MIRDKAWSTIRPSAYSALNYMRDHLPAAQYTGMRERRDGRYHVTVAMDKKAVGSSSMPHATRGIRE